MRRANEKLSLGAFFNPTGHHVASWRHPQSQADAGVNFEHYVEIARTAERGKMDMVFLADSNSVREAKPEALARSAQYIANMEPITLLSAIAAMTSRIGLVATASTSYNEPYHVARKYASLDHISKGRAGWNLVTSGQDTDAYNFSRDAHYEHGERYQRAHEFAEVVVGLWDSWDDDAFIRDKESGIFLDPDKMHRLDHKGEWFSVRGPLNVPRAPQGRPIIVQAGGSEDAIPVQVKFADVIFSGPLNIEQARDFYAKLKGRLGEFGRAPEEVKILPNLSCVVGRTEAEAEEKQMFLDSLAPPIQTLEILSTICGHVDFTVYPLDGPMPDIEPTKTSNQSLIKNIVEVARQRNLTLEQTAQMVAGSRGKFTIHGTPEHIADVIEEWFRTDACDGFNVAPAYLPGALDDFVDMVIPELQRRGLFRTEYEGTTLREHLGLERPESRHAKKPSAAKEPQAADAGA